MKLWRFDDPRDAEYASAGGRGAWRQPRPGSRSERVQPLIIEWEPGSDVIGDFTRTALGVIVTERVGKALLERFRGFGLGPVEMIQGPKLKHPQRVTRRTKRRVWLPYEGPPLHELWVTAWVDADHARSTLEGVGVHPDSGSTIYKVKGAERTEWRGSFPDPIEPVRVPREPGEGVYVAEEELRGKGIFYLSQAPGYTFCTEAVRRFVTESGFTNVDFFEIGDTL